MTRSPYGLFFVHQAVQGRLLVVGVPLAQRGDKLVRQILDSEDHLVAPVRRLGFSE